LRSDHLMPQKLLRALLSFAPIALLLAATPASAAPQVVASIKPIHALVAGVMSGIGEPGLIVAGSASPHAYALRPSDARRLEKAQLIFWIGPIFEGFLIKPLAALGGKADIVELDRAPGITLLPARHGGAWEEDDDEHDHRHASAVEQDGHLWLDPGNAKAIVRIAVARLSALDPASAARYAANGARIERDLTALDAAIAERLEPVRRVPFVVFHDAYGYFEHRYGLDGIGSVTVTPEATPGARRVRAIRDKIRGLGARCVFSEPQFKPALMETITAGTSARSGTLDPEGTALAAGPGLYAKLMDDLADNLARCLGGPS
ncbi:MAG TPA: zinc ABC transporter substrate-binding protein, partial [Stellaceae bacterium]|nr:zinc ABC transporter substrate-binding protein [Stellaceae bacterium]